MGLVGVLSGEGYVGFFQVVLGQGVFYNLDQGVGAVIILENDVGRILFLGESDLASQEWVLHVRFHEGLLDLVGLKGFID